MLRPRTDSLPPLDPEDDSKSANTDLDHYEGQVKRSNFVKLLMDEYEADKFVATHLYGAIKELNPNASIQDMSDILNMSISRMDESFMIQERAT